MSGKATVTKVHDWLTPFEVEVAIDGRPPSSVRFAAPGKAQTYALAMAEKHELDLVYNVDQQFERITVTPAMFAARVNKICAKCREAKPLAEFRGLVGVNRGGLRGEVPNGWADRCEGCEAEHGE